MAKPGTPVNETEAFVFRVCRKTFLSVWCSSNPVAEPGKELCDVLIVCDPHVIIISVKDVRLREGDLEVEHAKWERKAVDDSAKQIYGAERWLSTASQVVQGDGLPGLSLPPVAWRRVHRIAVAFGGRGEVVVASGDFGKGFVHVMTEHSFLDVLKELDTISDLVEYLAAKEAFLAKCRVVAEGSEANLVGLYLANNRSFPSGADMLITDDTIWRGIQEEPGFKLRKAADQESYVWDTLVELLSDVKAKSVSGPGPTLGELELALRTVAREPRLSRRVLGKALREFLDRADELRSRVLITPGGTLYVFVWFRPDEEPKDRTAELGCRCLAARHKVGQGDTIIGIGLSKHLQGVGSTSDLIYMHVPTWSSADDERAAKMQQELGFFAKAGVQHSHADEYPKGV
jgi:hypothetical protein